MHLNAIGFHLQPVQLFRLRPLAQLEGIGFFRFFLTALSTFCVCQYDSHDMGGVELSFIAVCVSNSFPSCFSLF